MTVCKEHEWVIQTMTITGGHTAKSTVCIKCGESWPIFIKNLEISKPIDFHIKDNIEVIEDNEFEIFKAGYDSANVEYESESVEELYKEFKKQKTKPEKK